MSDHQSVPKQKKSATVRNPTIEAVVKQLLRLPTEAAAIKKMQALKSHFMTSKMQIPNDKVQSIVMWIKGFEVSDQELAAGYLGHFAVIAPKKLADGKYTLSATKMHIDIKLHPAKKYQAKKQRHPNWGHPLIRRIKKDEVYTSIEEAAAILLKLHEEYPEVSIPGELKLYIMIFSKAPKGEKPIKKWIFEIKKIDEHSCKIEYRENQRDVASHDKPPIPAKDNPIMGYFTAKTAMKRRKQI